MTRKLHFLVSAGPTHEPIDAVRYIGNRSSGQLGILIAQAAQSAGHSVTLVLGPTHLEAPANVTTLRVETAAEMLAALSTHFDACDALVMAAAVADVRPALCADRKLKKDELGATLALEKNTDILAHLGRMRRHQVVVGFARETLHAADAIAEAARKANAKRCDLVVLNSPRSLGGELADSVSFVRADGSAEFVGVISKQDLAARLIQFCALAGSKKT